MAPTDCISANLSRIRSAMEAACQRSGRAADAARLVAVTKYAAMEWVKILTTLGQWALGESRPQQLAARAGEFSANGVSSVEWHMIGHLQRNKVDLVVPVCTLIHSVDSVRLARRISQIATRQQRTVPILFEVNVSGESSKDGFAPEGLQAAWDDLIRLPGLEIRGLMTMAPRVDNPEQARPYFAQLRELRDGLAARLEDECPLPELSMGMSGDFEVAIEEGATIVRIGSSLFAGLSQESAAGAPG